MTTKAGAMVPRKVLICFLLVAGVWNTLLWAAPKLPSIKGALTDEGGTLAKADFDQIDKQLGATKDLLKLDLAVWVLKDPVASVESVATEAFATWGIGKTWENGVLLAVASDRRSCGLIQRRDQPFFSPKESGMIKGVLEDGLRTGGLATGLRLASSRALRLGLLHKPLPTVAPPFYPNYDGARRYAFAVSMILILAGVSTRLRK